MNLSLVNRRSRPIRGLAGFKKNHRIPDKADPRAEKFIADIAHQEIKEELSKIFQRLRKEYGLRRADMQVSHELDTGAIDTPYFQFSIVVNVDPDRPADVVWQRQVTDIRDRIQVLADPFERVFSNAFDTVEYYPPVAIEIDDVIDRVEDLEDDRVTLEYDMDATHCTIEIEGSVGTLLFSPQSVLFTSRDQISTKELLESFLKMQEMMIQLRVVQA